MDRIRASWIGEGIERYVAWLTERRYAARNVSFRVPVLVRFGDFARTAGASSFRDLPAHLEPFVDDWLSRRKQHYSESQRLVAARELRNPIRQLLRLLLPQHAIDPAAAPDPFVDVAPGFFDFLRRDRGLREATLVQYRHYLARLKEYLQKIERPLLPDLRPTDVTGLIIESGETLDKRSVQSLCSILKVFFRYLYRVGLVTRDLSKAIESPRRYSLSNLPRSIMWSEVEQMLLKVDRRSVIGKRDYAILLLLVTYGLRAREVGALTLDDIDWKRDRLDVRGRKAGHSTAYPLTRAVGEALLDYLKQGRPETNERVLFIGAYAPYPPLSRVAVSMRAKFYLRKAGIKVPRPGSHTLRHTLRSASCRFRLFAQNDWRFYWTPHSRRYQNLCQGERRSPSPSRARKRRGVPVKSTTKGPLADGIARYLAHKHALGKQLAKVGPMLYLLDGYLVASGVKDLCQITPADISGFVESRPRHSPRSYNGLIGALRGLFDWMVVHEMLYKSPLRCESRRITAVRQPFLFDVDQARRLLDAAAQLPSNPRALARGEMYKMIFAILYGLGLRVGEVSRLCRKDIDLDARVLLIRQTKFGKDRLVPFGPKMASEIAAFLQREEARFGPIMPDSPVFSFGKQNRKAIGTGAISWTFHKLMPALQLVVPAGVAPPHLHCSAIPLPSVPYCDGIGRVWIRWHASSIFPPSSVM